MHLLNCGNINTVYSTLYKFYHGHPANTSGNNQFLNMEKNKLSLCYYLHLALSEVLLCLSRSV